MATLSDSQKNALPENWHKIPPGCEEKAQAHFMAWLYRSNRRLWAYTHHSPGGGHRNKVTASRLRTMGTKRGFPDLVSVYRVGPFRGIACELKTARGHLGGEQKDWLKTFMQESDFVTFCTDSMIGAQAIYTAYAEGDFTQLQRNLDEYASFYCTPAHGRRGYEMAARTASNT